MTTNPDSAPKLALLGCGNMATAIVVGAIRSGRFGPGDFIAMVPSEASRERLGGLGIPAVSQASELKPALDGGARLMMAVKPQIVEEASKALPQVSDPIGVINIAAGWSNADLAEVLQCSLGKRPRVVRTMPNTPSMVGEGMTAIAPAPDASAEDIALTESLFRSVGEIERIEEPMIDPFTAVAGSGPAYIFRFTELMARAGERLGLSPTLAARLARQTAVGAGALMADSDLPPEKLCQNVTSKGGMTAEALRVFEENGLDEIVSQAAEACAARGAVLAREAADRRQQR
ncbi:MAG: pyrroline-5-carboxylate reductase [Planctomycetota bacterium]